MPPNAVTYRAKFCPDISVALFTAQHSAKATVIIQIVRKRNIPSKVTKSYENDEVNQL